MPQKKEELPINVDVDLQNGGTITYANEVIAIIAGVAANEVEGIAGMCTASTGISDVFSRNKNITKGVKVDVGTEEVSVDVYLNVEYGVPIQTAATNVQESVRKSIETMTGLHVVRVDVHVQGLSFEKEKNDHLVGLEGFEEQNTEKPDAPAQQPAAEEPAAQPVEEPVQETEEPAVEAAEAEVQEQPAE